MQCSAHNKFSQHSTHSWRNAFISFFFSLIFKKESELNFASTLLGFLTHQDSQKSHFAVWLVELPSIWWSKYEIRTLSCLKRIGHDDFYGVHVQCTEQICWRKTKTKNESKLSAGICRKFGFYSKRCFFRPIIYLDCDKWAFQGLFHDLIDHLRSNHTNRLPWTLVCPSLFGAISFTSIWYCFPSLFHFWGSIFGDWWILCDTSMILAIAIHWCSVEIPRWPSSMLSYI